MHYVLYCYGWWCCSARKTTPDASIGLPVALSGVADVVVVVDYLMSFHSLSYARHCVSSASNVSSSFVVVMQLFLFLLRSLCSLYVMCEVSIALHHPLVSLCFVDVSHWVVLLSIYR